MRKEFYREEEAAYDELVGYWMVAFHLGLTSGEATKVLDFLTKPETLEEWLSTPLALENPGPNLTQTSIHLSRSKLSKKTDNTLETRREHLGENKWKTTVTKELVNRELVKRLQQLYSKVHAFQLGQKEVNETILPVQKQTTFANGIGEFIKANKIVGKALPEIVNLIPNADKADFKNIRDFLPEIYTSIREKGCYVAVRPCLIFKDKNSQDQDCYFMKTACAGHSSYLGIRSPDSYFNGVLTKAEPIAAMPLGLTVFENYTAGNSFDRFLREILCQISEIEPYSFHNDWRTELSGIKNAERITRLFSTGTPTEEEVVPFAEQMAAPEITVNIEE